MTLLSISIKKTNKTMEKVKDYQIKHILTGQLVSLSSLWEKQTVVIAFLRRWG